MRPLDEKTTETTSIHNDDVDQPNEHPVGLPFEG